MIIVPTREKFIHDNFIELSFDDRRPDLNKFQDLSSIEQYYLADIYNWDDGTEILNWIVDSEKCDKGTAALIFWRAEPDFYINRTSTTIEKYEIEVFDLLKKIVSKFNSNSFKRSRLKFNPDTRVSEIDWDKTYEDWGKIPAELKSPTRGIKPISLSRILTTFAQWQRRRKEKMREAKRLKRKQNAA